MYWGGVTMKIRSLLLLSLLLCLAGATAAQTTAIRAGHIVDPATGTVQANQIILIDEDGKITAVGANLQVPDGATVIDLSHSWVLPGLMDAHTHLTFSIPAGQSLITPYLTESTTLRGMRGLRNARIVLEAGFTTVKDIGNAANYADSDLRRAIERGWFPGPTLLTAGKIIAPFGGQSLNVPLEQGPFWQYEYLDADTPDEIRKAVRQNLYYGANTIKLVADNSNFFYSLEEIRAAVEEAHNAGVTISIHVMRDAPARNVILGGADSIEHGFELSDDVLSLMKEHGTILVGTDFPAEHLEAMNSLDGNLGQLIINRLQRAHSIGVKMAFGTDVVIDMPGKTRADMMLDYLAVWEAAGVPPAGILKAMTTNAAELMRVEKERGAIRPGLQADIIATPENPLENIHTLRQVHFVMKDGTVIKQ